MTDDTSVFAGGILRVWALDLDELIEIAEDEVTRELTERVSPVPAPRRRVRVAPHVGQSVTPITADEATIC